MWTLTNIHVYYVYCFIFIKLSLALTYYVSCIFFLLSCVPLVGLLDLDLVSCSTSSRKGVSIRLSYYIMCCSLLSCFRDALSLPFQNLHHTAPTVIYSNIECALTVKLVASFLPASILPCVIFGGPFWIGISRSHGVALSNYWLSHIIYKWYEWSKGTKINVQL